MGPAGSDRAAEWHRRWEDRWADRWEHEWATGGPPNGPAQRWRRLWLPVIISLIVQVPTAVFSWRFDDSVGVDPQLLAVRVGVALVGPLALIAARRFPGPVVAIVALAASADLLLTSHSGGPPYIALAFAIVGAVVRGARIWAWISVAAAWLLTLGLAGVFGVNWQPARIAAVTLGILVFMGVGEGIRTRKERFDQVRRTIAERKQSEVQAERVRIARELHDVLAHSLSQINVQAGVGLHLMDKQPEKAAEALASIKETSKTALDEVRSVLGVLRAEGGADPSAPLVPEPDLSRLPGLVASVTAQGVTVSLVNELDSTPTAAVQLAIYRIVQESLTNVVRHADATKASVTLTEEGGRYRVEVRDNGHGGRSTPGAGGGRGLLGMLERAELLGGELVTESIPARGFSVVASIPAPKKADSS